MSTTELDRILRDAVDTGAVPNVAVVVADRDGVIYEGAAGPRAAGTDEPVTADSHFWIMSMTTKLGTVAALQQVEAGRLDLDAPVEDYCPEFGKLQVLDGFDGQTPRLRQPASRATVRQLLNHTAGLGYWFFSEELMRYLDVEESPDPGPDGLALEPLLADPGTVFTYGLSSDWLSRVVEAAAGQPLAQAVRDGITGPLGMDRTSYTPTDADRANLVPGHMRAADGSWVATEVVLQLEQQYFAGGHGLCTTPRDYLQFQRALLGNGTVDGVRILQDKTVDEAFTDQLGGLAFPEVIPTTDPAVSCDLNFGPGFTWGLGLLLTTGDIPDRRRAGSGSWAGLLNSQFWVDRSAGITGAVHTQLLPYAPPESMQLLHDVETAVYALR